MKMEQKRSFCMKILISNIQMHTCKSGQEGEKSTPREMMVRFRILPN